MADASAVSNSPDAAHLEVAAVPFDPRRPRSAGPLSRAERTLCLEAGIAIAFDPVQQGWVPLECVDDLEVEMPADIRGDASPVRDEARLVGRLRELARAELRAHVRDGREDARTVDAIRALPARLVEAEPSGDAEERLVVLRHLQAQAHAILVDRLLDDRARARRRHTALVDGHATQLRPWRESDAPRFRALLDDAEVWRHLPEDPPASFDERLARDLIQVSNEGTHHEVRAVEFEGELVGQARLLFAGRFNAIDAGGIDAEISYWFGRHYWGRGLARRVIPLVTLLAFRKRPLASIFARVEEANVASRRALERAGYVDEGDLSATWRNEPTMRVYRAFRADYLDPEPRDRRDTQRPDAGRPTESGPVARA